MTPNAGAPTEKPSHATYDVEAIRRDFPILNVKVHGKPLVYLDNAASTQKPQCVIDAISKFYSEGYANIHRGVHRLSELATASYEGARHKVRDLLGASDSREIVFTRGTTEGVNLIASSFVRPRLKQGDEILVTGLEHHSNIVPWQMACQQTGAHLKVIPIDDDGQLVLESLDELLSSKTRFIAIPHVSNALGTIVPVREICERAQAKGIPVMVDGAQAVARMKVDVRELGCDFYVMSGHKLYGPTGIGAMWGKAEHLEAMSPYQGGGDMILTVTFEETTYNEIPYKFEAGTPDIAGVIGLGAAIDYVRNLGLDAIDAHEHSLLEYGTEALSAIDGLRILGTAKERTGLISFVLEGIHPHDIGTILDQSGVAIRAGHHCAQPVMDRFSVAATARASFALYNTKEEIDALVDALKLVKEVFG